MKELFSNFYISDSIKPSNNECFIIICTSNFFEIQYIKNAQLSKQINFYSDKKHTFLIDNSYDCLNNNKHVCIVYNLNDIELFTSFMFGFCKKYSGIDNLKEFIDMCIYNEIPFLC